MKTIRFDFGRRNKTCNYVRTNFASLYSHEVQKRLSAEHVSGAENGAERAENGVSGSGAVSGCRKIS